MNSDHVATIREALTEWQHSIFDGCNIGKLDDPDKKICEIDAALDALEEGVLITEKELDAIKEERYDSGYQAAKDGM